jgi:hypothetical protein
MMTGAGAPMRRRKRMTTKRATGKRVNTKIADRMYTKDKLGEILTTTGIRWLLQFKLTEREVRALHKAYYSECKINSVPYNFCCGIEEMEAYYLRSLPELLAEIIKKAEQRDCAFVTISLTRKRHRIVRQLARVGRWTEWARNPNSPNHICMGIVEVPPASCVHNGPRRIHADDWF